MFLDGGVSLLHLLYLNLLYYFVNFRDHNMMMSSVNLRVVTSYLYLYVLDLVILDHMIT